MSKIVKFAIIGVSILLVTWLSLDIQSLEKYKATLKPESFNAADYAENFWNNSLPASMTSAPNIYNIVQLLNENPETAFEKYGHKLGISKTYYFMIKGNGIIEKVENEFLVLSVYKDIKVKILTDFIYGNAVRDGSGKVNIDDFLNMTDFNTVSVAINNLVKEKVAARLKKSAKTGQELVFAGAIEVNEENIDLNIISIIPVSIKITDGKTE